MFCGLYGCSGALIACPGGGLSVLCDHLGVEARYNYSVFKYKPPFYFWNFSRLLFVKRVFNFTMEFGPYHGLKINILFSVRIANGPFSHDPS